MKKLLILSIILYSNWVSCQNTSLKTFSGNFMEGVATYSYYENSDYERIYNGEFSYRGEVENYEGLKIYINGAFKEDQRDGKWNFTVKNSSSSIYKILSAREKSAIKFMLNMSSYGNIPQKDLQAMENAFYNGKIAEYKTYTSNLSGHYKAGKLNGIWIYNQTSSGGRERELTNEINPPTSSTVSFKDNYLIDDFIFKQDESNYVSGQFDSIGNMDGKWIVKWVSKEIEFENVSEYKNGVLLKIIERNMATGEILYQDIESNYSGKQKIAEAIFFWIKPDETNFNQISITKRNYMYFFEKGVSKPIYNFNF